MSLLRKLILAACCIAPATSHSMSLETYKGAKDSSEAKFYIGGVGAGFAWANTELRARKDSPLYCTPSKLALNADNYSQILMSYVDKMTAKGLIRPDDHVELLLIYALKEAFPCGTELRP